MGNKKNNDEICLDVLRIAMAATTTLFVAHVVALKLVAAETLLAVLASIEAAARGWLCARRFAVCRHGSIDWDMTM